MTRSMFLAIASALAVAAVPAGSALASTMAKARARSAAHDTITVSVSRPRQTSLTYTGIPVDTLTANSAINIADLDLSKPAGRRQLTDRVDAAARDDCNWLNQLYPMSKPVGSSDMCEQNAIARAQPQIRAAINAA